MSQPQNLGADDLQHLAPLTAVPTRTTDISPVATTAAQDMPATTTTSAPEPTEALMAVTNPTPAANEPVAPMPTAATAQADQAPTLTPVATSAEQSTTVAAVSGSGGAEGVEAPIGSLARPEVVLAPVAAVTREADAVGMLASVARPRLRSVGGGGDGHSVPATARYADELTDGALALRLQAITRLGVTSSPRHLSSIAAANNRVDQAARKGQADDAGEQATEQGRKLSVVPADARATQVDAAPAQPDGAQAPLTPTTSTPRTSTARTSTARTSTARTSTATARAATAGAVQTAGAPSSSVRAGTASADSTSARTATGRAGEQRGAGPVVPEVRAWAGRLAQAVSEVLAGDRPISQLVRFTDDGVFMELNRRVRMLGLNTTAVSRGAKEKCAVRSVRVFMVEPSIAEVAAHVRHGERSRAFAFRLEIRRSRWVCTALELG